MPFKRLFLASPALAAFLLWFTHGTELRASHLSVENLLQLDTRSTASVMEEGTSYEKQKTFLSEIYETDFSFQLLGLNWAQDLPEKTAAQLEIRFRNTRGVWSDWKQIHEDEDAPTEEDGLWTYVITEESEAFQYRVDLSTDEESLTPKLYDISFDYVNGGELSPAEELTKLVFHDGDPRVISRSEWGANESYGLASNYGGDDGDDDLETDHPEYPDQEIARVDQKDEYGRELIWPRAYPVQKPSKIIIHHTATTDDLDDPAAAIRAIHYYHAVTRGWGDIGYNYIIAPDGRVFEGRAGGESVVGGHTVGYNTGSIGMSLLGNYQEESIPAEMMQSLTGLIYEKALYYGIDPDGTSTFRGQNLPNIMGHRDLAATACPGEFSYDYLPQIRSVVADSLDSGRRINGSSNYAFEETLDRPLVTLNPGGDSAVVTVKVKNTGTKAWNSSTFLTVNGVDTILDIKKESNKSVAKMKESSVSPGGTATFSFTVSSKWEAGLVNRDMALIFNGSEKNSHTMDLAVFVEDPILAFKVKEIDAPTTLKPGQKDTVTVHLENTGNLPWMNSGTNKVTLKPKSSSTLTNAKTLSGLEEKQVKVGEVGTFSFEITGPSSGGSKSLEFELDIEGTEAISKGSGRITVRGTGAKENAVIKDHDDLSFMPGEERIFSVQITNTGTKKWTASGTDAFSLSIKKPEEVLVGKTTMRLRTVSPGVSVRVYFSLTAPEKPGSYTFELTPKLGTEALMSPYALTMKVEDVQGFSIPEEEHPIRVRLTPDNVVPSHVISSNESFVLYEEDVPLKTFNANSLLRFKPEEDLITVSGGTYKISSGKPLRVAPADGEGIVNILTMEQRPAWNTSLNDNRFRGSLEVRMVEGQMALINELPLNDYLKGIGEVSNNTHPEKIKTILVLARTYAYYYMSSAEKFPGKPYHLDDSPESSQKYLGYGFESRSDQIVAMVEATDGEVVTYKGKLVNRPTPYFTQTAGGKTKSAQEVWGWTDTPWLVPVSDSHCKATTALGHQVGLSGCGADAFAQQGKSYEEIIKYYYTGVEVEKLL